MCPCYVCMKTFGATGTGTAQGHGFFAVEYGTRFFT